MRSTYYIDRDETVDAVLREVVDYFRQWAFDNGKPLGMELGVQANGHTDGTLKAIPALCVHCPAQHGPTAIGATASARYSGWVLREQAGSQFNPQQSHRKQCYFRE